MSFLGLFLKLLKKKCFLFSGINSYKKKNTHVNLDLQMVIFSHCRENLLEIKGTTEEIRENRKREKGTQILKDILGVLL